MEEGKCVCVELAPAARWGKMIGKTRRSNSGWVGEWG